MRHLSYSQLMKLMRCQTMYDFSYIGSRLHYRIEPITPAPRLSFGSAWGKAMQEYHRAPITSDARVRAIVVLAKELQPLRGLLLTEEAARKYPDTLRAFEAYMDLEAPMGLSNIERELTVPIDAENTFTCKIDGIANLYDHGRTLIDFKLRTKPNFMSAEETTRNWQNRLYGWACRELGIEVQSIGYHEASVIEMNPVRYTSKGMVHGTQTCSLDEYLAACLAKHQEPAPTTVERLRDRAPVRYQFKVEPLYDLDWTPDVEAMLNSAITLIQLMEGDYGFEPLRNISKATCPSCEFLPICDHPFDDVDLIRSLYSIKEATDAVRAR